MESKIVGIFDSGVGGLTILRAVHSILPDQPLVYFADQAHVPYGSRSLDEVRKYSEHISRFLIGQGAGVIVVACNTASAAALHDLREKFPETAFVGMEPAVKPAAEKTQSGVVGVLATPATFQGELFASVMERFSGGVTVLKDTCPGLVARIENGDLDTAETRAILEKALLPMIVAGGGFDCAGLYPLPVCAAADPGDSGRECAGHRPVHGGGPPGEAGPGSQGAAGRRWCY